MAGDPTHTPPHAQRHEPDAVQEWYVVTSGGRSALRMTPGLTVGEAQSGALVLNDPAIGNQWVEFVLADSGEPWATVVTRDKSLRVGSTTCLRHPLQAGTTIKLPSHTLHISRDIRTPPPSGTVIEVVHRDIPELLQDLMSPVWEESLGVVREPAMDAPAPGLADPERLSRGRDPAAAAPPQRPRDVQDDWPDEPLWAPEPQVRRRPPPAAARRRQMAVLGGVLVLAGAVVVLVSLDGEPPGLSTFNPFPVDAPPVQPPAQTAMPAEPSGRHSLTPPERIERDFAVRSPSQAPSPEADTALPFEALTAVDPEPAADDPPPPSGVDAAMGAEPESLAPPPRAEPPLAPVDIPPVERRSPVDVVQTAEPVEPEPAPALVRTPDPAVVAALDETGLMVQAVSSDLALRRDLRAANLALAQGRLTDPPESNAYALYSRVLAADPDSPQAVRGLQSVRQGLINRALAGLAGGDLEAARAALEAAADAGADAQLVANLRGEVDFRQQQLDSGS